MHVSAYSCIVSARTGERDLTRLPSVHHTPQVQRQWVVLEEGYCSVDRSGTAVLQKLTMTTFNNNISLSAAHIGAATRISVVGFVASGDAYALH